MDQIIDLIENRKFKELRQILVDKQPADIAEVMGELRKCPPALRLLPKDLAVEVFSLLEPTTRQNFPN